MLASQGRLHTCWRAYLGVPGSAGGRATPGGSGGCAASCSSPLLAFPRPPVWAPPASIPPSLPCPAFILQAAVHALSHATYAHPRLCLFWGDKCYSSTSAPSLQSADSLQATVYTSCAGMPAAGNAVCHSDGYTGRLCPSWRYEGYTRAEQARICVGACGC